LGLIFAVLLDLAVVKSDHNGVAQLVVDVKREDSDKDKSAYTGS
jgi:hypothetical protein